MIKDAKYLGPVGIGATAPQRFRDVQGSEYIVKLYQNRLGPKVLVNELLAALLGEKMALCFPPSDILCLSFGKWQGLHFACRFLPHAHYLSRYNLARAENIKQLAGIMLFDHLFWNLDRTHNSKNLLLCRQEQQDIVYAIDHSHLFRNGIWTTESLAYLAEQTIVNHERLYGVLLKYYLKPADFYTFVEAVKKLSLADIQTIIAKIPEIWLPSSQERGALEGYIITRQQMVDEIAQSIYALIPDYHWCANPNMLE